MKTLEDEWYVVIKAYTCKFTIFEILRDILCYHILRVCAIPTYRVYRLYYTTPPLEAWGHFHSNQCLSRYHTLDHFHNNTILDPV